MFWPVKAEIPQGTCLQPEGDGGHSTLIVFGYCSHLVANIESQQEFCGQIINTFENLIGIKCCTKLLLVPGFPCRWCIGMLWSSRMTQGEHVFLVTWLVHMVFGSRMGSNLFVNLFSTIILCLIERTMAGRQIYMPYLHKTNVDVKRAHKLAYQALCTL